MTTKKPQKQIQTASTTSKKESNNTPIVIAIIGLLGVVITAIFGYMGTLALNKQSNTGVTPFVNSSPTNWPEFASYELYFRPCQPTASVVPDYITLVQNDPSSYERINELDELTNLPIAPLQLEDPQIYNIISISNSSATTGDWIKIENSISVTINVLSEDVKHVNLWRITDTGCGGVSGKFFLPEISLNHNNDSLPQTIKSDEYDFFTLQPGEFDEFNLTFICDNPGTYNISDIELKVSYKNRTEVVHVPWGDTIIVCPDTYSFWYTKFSYLVQKSFTDKPQTSPMTLGDDYFWNGRQYEKVVP